eukprot:scaffold109706_cov18-Tisochrysis_lutea.AAC.1
MMFACQAATAHKACSLSGLRSEHECNGMCVFVSSLQVVTRAQLAPHTLRTPRVTITAKDVHSNTVNLPVGTLFDLLVVQKEQQEQQQQQQQLEWLVDRIVVPAVKA